jgi:hypothetical protein
MFAEAVTAVALLAYREEAGGGPRRFVEAIAEVLPTIEADVDRPALRVVFRRENGVLRPASRPLRRGFSAEELGLADLPWSAGAAVW